LRRPAFVAVAVLTLALGIGASSSIFTVVNAVVLRPLPYPQPDSLVMVLEQNLQRGWVWYTVSPANFLDWQQETDTFQAMAAYSLYADTGYNLTGEGAPERILTSAVTADFFRVFQAAPFLGRGFAAGEDEPGADDVVVLSHGLWQRRFGGDPQILDRTLLMDGRPHRVIGVMGPEFRYPATTELWLPLAFDAQQRSNRLIRSLFVVARLQAGVGLEEAQVRMKGLAGRLEAAYPEANAGFGVVIHRLHDRVVGDVRPALIVLLVAVACLLLIACANVANLILTRASERARELTLRQALGASRQRLSALLLVESLVLAALGGLLGLILAWAATRTLVALAPARLPRLEEVTVDGRVLLFTLLAALVTAVLFSLAPLAKLRHLSLVAGLRAGSRGAGDGPASGRLRQSIIAAQVAFALMLLVAAGLAARSFLRLQDQELGFRPQGLLSMQLALPAEKYADAGAQGLFFSELVARAEAQPGVKAAAVTSWLPFASVTMDWDFHVEGRPPRKLDDTVVAGFRAVSSTYFEAMGITLRQGRLLAATDRQDSPTVVVINETMARRFWNGEEAVGQHLVLGDLVQKMLPGLPLKAEVVGVVADVKQTGLALPVEPEMYVPFPQYCLGNMFLVVRSNGDPARLTGALRHQIQIIDPAQPIYDIKPMAQRIGESVADSRLTVLLLGLFSLLALILAAVGIYSVISYTMSQRTREIGIRIALGAERRDVLGWVLRQGLLPPLVGIFLGLLGAAVFSRLLAGFLFEVSPWDATTFLTIPLFLLSVSLLAAFIPALRISRTDPLRALQQD
jgi:putative ABC transport system permease protein